MSFIRVLIPSWRFFDRLGHVPQLVYREKFKNGKTGASYMGEWKELFQKPPRFFWNIFLNPKGNLYLAQQSLVERLLDDSQKTKNLEEQISFQLIKSYIQKNIDSSQFSHFEFKICVNNEDILSTPEYEV